MSDDDQNDQEPGRLRQMLEEANARAAAAEQKASDMSSREMFRDAGLDLANKQHAAFAKAYDGAPDPEAVKAYVTDLGITREPPAPTPTDPVDGREAQERIAAAAAGDGTPPPTPDRRQELGEELARMSRNKNTPKAEIERVAREFSRAGGHPVKELYE